MSEPRNNRSRALTTLTLLLSGMMVFSIRMPAQPQDRQQSEALPAKTAIATAETRYAAFESGDSVPAAAPASPNTSDAAVASRSTANSASTDGTVVGGGLGAAENAIATADTGKNTESEGAEGSDAASDSSSAAHTLRAPVIQAPMADAVLGISDRTFSWKASPDADRYHVILTDMIRWRRVYDRNDIRRTQVTLPPGILHFGGSFSLSVQAIAGTETSEPVRTDFTVRNLPLPIITHPASDASLDLADVSLVWEPVPGINEYHVVVKDTVTWKTVLDRKRIKDTRCLLEASHLAIGGQYRLYVHPSVNGEDGAPAHVDIHTMRLSSPRLLAPEAGAIVGLGDVSVSWDPVLMATSYHVALTRPDTGEVVLERRDIPEPAVTLGDDLLQPGATYRIFVFACVGTNESAPTYGDFTVKPLETPVLTSPASGEKVPLATLDIEWNPVPGAEQYKLVMTDTLSWQPVLQVEHLTEPAYAVDAERLSRGGQYRIYVHAVRDGVESAPGMVDVTTEALSQPRMIAPLNAAELPLGDLEISWHAVPGAEQYRVTLTDTVTWEICSTQAGVTDTSCRIDASLLSPDRTYRIYVSAMAGAGESAPTITDIRTGR